MLGSTGVLVAGLLLGLPNAFPNAEAEHKKAEELVQRLGHTSFRVRDAAYRELVALGLPARSAVVKGLDDPDLDVSDSCRRLMPYLRELYLREQIERFLADPKKADSTGLPGVKRWLEIAGDDQASRTHYACLVKQYQEIVHEVETDKGRERFQDFCNEMYRRRYPVLNNGVRVVSKVDFTTEEVELYLFLASHPNMHIDGAPLNMNNRAILLGSNVFFSSQVMQKLLSGNDRSVPVRRLFLNLLKEDSSQFVAERALRVAVQVEMREAGPVAMKVVQDPKQSPSYRGTACLALAKLGSDEQLKELAALAKDDTEVGQAIFLNNGPANRLGGKVLLGDIAMATVLQAKKQKLSDYGYSMNEELIGIVFLYPNYYGFETDEKRKTSREKFAAWWAEEQKKKK